MDHAAKGDAALSNSNPALALEHFDTAISQNPTAAPYYIKRSTAYQRLQKYPEALSDAEQGVVLAVKRANRDLISRAQFRRAVALFHLGKYVDAEFCFELAKKFDAKDKMVDIWIGKCKGKIAGPGMSEGPVTVKEVPDVEDVVVPAASSRDGDTSKTQQTSNGSSEVPLKVEAAPATATVPTAADKVRHDWYQSAMQITFTLLARGITDAAVEIEPRSLSISYPISPTQTYDFSLDPLYAAIDPATSSYKVMSTKLEIILKKAEPGVKWPSLEGKSEAEAETEEKKQVGPAYPTSSKSGPKNWDKIASSYTKPAESSKSTKGETDGEEDKKESDKKGEDDIYIDEYDDEGDPANAFFKKLYAGADPDVRRAMMKSYQESGGTALSTNWAEVGSKKVEVTPPDGMEARKW